MGKRGKEAVGDGLVKYHNKLLGYAFSLTHDIGTARELLQEIALYALCNADKYEEKGLFYAWASRTMKNRFINKENSEKLHHIIGYDDIPTGEIPFSISEADCNIDYIFIKEIISTLPDKLATGFLQAASGYSYEEIACAEKTSISSVKKNIHAARVALRKRIGGR